MPQHTAQTLTSPIFPTWCPGCGDYGIWASLKQAIIQSELPEENTVIVYGVGCSGNMADFNRVYGFHALHGRALANACGIKIANQDLHVIVIAGDGDTYGEGMGHFISAMRGNHNVTVIVHNNQTYGLTTGQSSPTTLEGVKTKSTPMGVIDEPVNPVALAMSCDVDFVARGYAGQIPHLTNLMKQAFQHPGFALVDVFQPCVTFNKVNTHQWFQTKVYDLQQTEYQANDRAAAWNKSREEDKLPIGVFYHNPESVPYHAQWPQLQNGPLVNQGQPARNIKVLLDRFV